MRVRDQDEIWRIASWWRWMRVKLAGWIEQQVNGTIDEMHPAIKPREHEIDQQSRNYKEEKINKSLKS
jgi:hypothetical protein